jgi:hypothetical protein
MTISVGAGSSPPNEENTSLKAGITKIMITVTTTKATTITATGYISADLIFCLMASVFSWYRARRSSSASRMPPASPASTRLQYSESKCSGCLRNADDRLVPVSTSDRMSFSSLVMRGLVLPRATMSNDCSSGTPAFIMVDSWRVKIAMSFCLIDLPPAVRRFLILLTRMPCRRRLALTTASPPARISPRTTLPLRSLPSHS